MTPAETLSKVKSSYWALELKTERVVGERQTIFGTPEAHPIEKLIGCEIRTEDNSLGFMIPGLSVELCDHIVTTHHHWLSHHDVPHGKGQEGSDLSPGRPADPEAPSNPELLNIVPDPVQATAAAGLTLDAIRKATKPRK